MIQKLAMKHWRPLSVIWILFLVAGCNGMQSETGESHSDHDEHVEHFVPEHYPDGLANIGEAIRLRIAGLTSGNENLDAEKFQKLNSELRDLIEWAPEIAADTDLPERDWIPIYELSEKIRKAMKSTPQAATRSSLKSGVDSVAADCVRLSEILDEAFAKLPKEILDFEPVGESNEPADGR